MGNVEWVPDSKDGRVWRAYLGKKRLCTIVVDDQGYTYGWTSTEDAGLRAFASLAGAAKALVP